MSKPKLWWIKERHNPQLGLYYVACGQMSNAEAKRMESGKYGSNLMLGYDSNSEYVADIERFKREGYSVQKY